MNLDDIHFSGAVPQCKCLLLYTSEKCINSQYRKLKCDGTYTDEKRLQSNMNRFFKRFPVDKPVTRANYSFQVVARPDLADPLDPTELAWAQTMKGDEETEETGIGGSGGNGNQAVIADLVADSSAPIEPSRVRMRVERETLRRLPRTGAVVFGIRTYGTPLDALAAEPGIPGRLASAIRSWPLDVAT
jgi:hypothetical protein